MPCCIYAYICVGHLRKLHSHALPQLSKLQRVLASAGIWHLAGCGRIAHLHCRHNGGIQSQSDACSQLGCNYEVAMQGIFLFSVHIVSRTA